MFLHTAKYWRKVLYNHDCLAAILIDLSKALDIYRHVLLIAKQRSYDLAEEAARLLEDTLATGISRLGGNYTQVPAKNFLKLFPS